MKSILRFGSSATLGRVNERLKRWDEKFARGLELHGFAPSPPLPAAIQGVSPGLALDLACGAGRHALFLAERGWRVQALDGSRTGLDRLMSEAGRRKIAGRIDARICDLESTGFNLEADAYDLACDFYFLHRPLFEQIRRAVRPGGLFVAAIHIVDAAGGAAPHAFLLAPGELRALVARWGWDILHDREGPSGESDHHHPTAEIVARRPKPDVQR
jgi:tellurite methyltransferase